MNKIKFYTIEELKKTGFKMFSSHVSADTEINERYLQSEVISKWDVNDYSKSYTYFDHHIRFVVNICYKESDTLTKFERLKKDLSNL